MNRIYPEEASSADKVVLRKLVAQFISFEGVLYKRMLDGTQLRCIDEKEAEEVMQEIHAGECGTHMNGLALAKKIMR